MRQPSSSLLACAVALTVIVLGAAAYAAEPMVRGGGDHALHPDADGTVLSWGNDVIVPDTADNTTAYRPLIIQVVPAGAGGG